MTPAARPLLRLADAGPDDSSPTESDTVAERRMHGRMTTLAKIATAATKWRKLTVAEQTLLELVPFMSNMLLDDVLKRARGAAPRIWSRHDQELLKPHATRFEGYVLVADVTGFTSLTERLDSMGTVGVELLIKCMNEFFGKAIQVVLRYGGDVMKFAGDALICAFRPTAAEELRSGDKGMEEAALRCLACARALSDDVGHVRMLENGDTETISHQQWLATELLKHQQEEGSSGGSQVKLRKHLNNIVTFAANASGLQEVANSFSRLSFRSGSKAASETAAVAATASPIGSEGAGLGTLSLKMMVGAGTITVYHCGGRPKRGRAGGAEGSSQPGKSALQQWEMFIGNDPHHPLDGQGRRALMVQIAALDSHAAAGEVVLSREMMDLVGEKVEAARSPDGEATLLGMRPPWKSLPGSRKEEPVDAHHRPLVKLMCKQVHPVQWCMVHMLRQHMMDNICQRIEAGHSEFVNEIRTLSLCYVGFPFLDYQPGGAAAAAAAVDAEPLDSVQHAMQGVQRVMGKFQGNMLQFRCDEKGFVAVCAFGLPSKNHHDNPGRAAAAALSLVAAMELEGRNAVAGVTTGDLLCVSVGSPARHEYTVFGDAINLSARLMCKAKAGLGRVLCDWPTRSLAGDICAFCPLEPLQLKGKAAAVQAYEAVDLKQEALDRWLAAEEAKPASARQGARVLVGRDHILDRIHRPLQHLIATRHGHTCLCLGAPGMGKTFLLEHLKHSDLNGMRPALSGVFRGAGSAAHQFQALHPWRAVFRSLLEHDLRVAKASQALSSTERRIMDKAGYVTNLARRVAASISEWEQVRHALADFLDLPLHLLPHTPETARQLQALAAGGEAGDAGADGTPAADALLRHKSLPLFSQASLKRPAAVRLPTAAEPTGPGAGGLPDAAQADVLSPSKAPAAGLSQMLAATVGAAMSTRMRQAARLRSQALPLTPRPGSPSGMPKPQLPPPYHQMPGAATWTPRLRRPERPKALLGSARQAGGGAAAADGAASRSPEDALPDGPPELGGQDVARLLLQVLLDFTDLYGPAVLLLDDLHHFDTLSWDLLLCLSCCALNGCLVVATLRPYDSPPHGMAGCSASADAQLQQQVARRSAQLQQQVCTVTLEMGPLSLRDVQLLLEQRLGAARVQEQDAQLVLQRSGGMPVYVDQVAAYIQKQMAGGGAGSREKISSLLKMSGGMRKVVLDSVDSLKPSEQLTLKVCSVIGTTVPLNILMLVYPMAVSQTAAMRRLLQRDLAVLHESCFLKPVDAEQELWQFTSMIQREIVYGVLPHMQRRGLHIKIAQALERDPDGPVSYSSLAFHWTQACKNQEASEVRYTWRALELWDLAGHEALSKAAPAEALRLFQKAANLAAVLANLSPANATPFMLDSSPDFEEEAGQVSPVVHELMRAEWERQMSWLSLLQTEEEVDSGKRADGVRVSMEHALEGLRLLQLPAPGSHAAASPRWWRALLCGGGCAGPPASRRGRRKESAEARPAEEVEFISSILDIIMLAALETDPVDSAMLRHVIFLCHHLAGDTIPPVSPLYPVCERCELEVKLAMRQQYLSSSRLSTLSDARRFGSYLRRNEAPPPPEAAPDASSATASAPAGAAEGPQPPHAGAAPASKASEDAGSARELISSAMLAGPSEARLAAAGRKASLFRSGSFSSAAGMRCGSSSTGLPSAGIKAAIAAPNLVRSDSLPAAARPVFAPGRKPPPAAVA